MFNMCKKQSKLELVACFAVGAMAGVMGSVMLCGSRPLRSMKRNACKAAHCVSDFVVDNIKNML